MSRSGATNGLRMILINIDVPKRSRRASMRGMMVHERDQVARMLQENRIPSGRRKVVVDVNSDTMNKPSARLRLVRGLVKMSFGSVHTPCTCTNTYRRAGMAVETVQARQYQWWQVAKSGQIHRARSALGHFRRTIRCIWLGRLGNCAYVLQPCTPKIMVLFL